MCIRDSSYTALRAVTISRDRFMLNGRPYLLRLVLDQGYWPQTLMAAPNDEALRQDVELAKAMGFNGVRKHQKIENPRYLYLSLIHISEPTRLLSISYAVFCLKKKKIK